MKRRVGVVGATGFLGGEALRLLVGHPNVEVARVAAGSSAGKAFGEVRPAFAGVVDGLVSESDPEDLAAHCDDVFLALPHGASADLAIALASRGVTVYDLGSDFRLRDPADHERYYGRRAPDPAWLERAVYCLPELTGAPPADAPIVACPGCFATALCLGLGPLAPYIAPGTRVAAFGATGSSGSGIQPAPGVHHSTRSTGFLAYKALTHQHLGEVRQQVGAHFALDFVPHSAPMVRGIHLTLILPTASLGIPPSEAYAIYADKPMVRAAAGTVNVGWANGSNRAFVGWAESEGATAVFVGIDNLLKGGAGQAVQIFNLKNGLPETAGIPMVGVWP
ncbi:MAG: N-acetyl-gamma-glutamyl-phosphate reductase [Fimbriimonadaceae bacterium]